MSMYIVIAKWSEKFEVKTGELVECNAIKSSV